MRKKKHLYTLLCWLIISVLFPVSVYAQLPTKENPGEAVGTSLTVHNSIVWDNVFESPMLNGDNNLVNKDPLYASQTDFFLQTGSSAIGIGNNTMNPLDYDIAGVLRGIPINAGAFENNISYMITIVSPAEGGTLAVYHGAVITTSGDEFTAGTELLVSAVTFPEYRLESLTANGGSIRNGDPYILTGNTTFEVTFAKGHGRPLAYATVENGGKLKVGNTIIYGNADEYGIYSLDQTNLISDPKFVSQTDFVLESESPALEKGDASKLPAGSSDLKGKLLASIGSVDAGAYQGSEFTIEWDNTQAGGTLEVFYLVENEAKQKVKVPVSNGDSYPGSTVVVKITPESGYILKEITANGELLVVEKGETSFALGANTVIEAIFRLVTGNDIQAAVYQEDGKVITLWNNIVYGNISVSEFSNIFTESPLATNISDDPVTPKNHLDGEDPYFYSVTNFRLQPGSIAIDKGNNNVVTLPTDIVGNARINGIVDMGAAESSSTGFSIVFRSDDLKDDKGVVYGRLEVTVDGVAAISGNLYPAGSIVKVNGVVLNDNYEWVGEVKVNNDYLGDGITEFTLEEDSKIGLTIRKKQFPVYYSATNGSVRVSSGTTLIPNGEPLSIQTILTLQVTPDAYHRLEFVSVNGNHIQGAEGVGGYIVTVSGETTITVACVPIYELDENGDPILEDPLGPNDDTNWKPAIVKGLLTWDALNAIVTVNNKADGSPVQSGDQLTAGTVVHVEIEPAATSGYNLVLIEVNGVSHPYTSFDLTIPAASAGAIKPTFIGVRYESTGSGQQPQPGSHQVIQSVTGNGTLTVKNGNSILQPGQSVESGTVLSIVATPANAYRLSSLTANGSGLLSGGTFTVLEATTISAFFEKETDPSQPTPDPATEKQVYITVQGSGSVTLQDGITAALIGSGDWVADGTSIVVTATAASGYELTSLQVFDPKGNGTNVVNGQAFTVTATSQVVAVFDRKGETPTPPVTPPVPPVNPGTEYVTLTIGGDLPAGVTINPGAGSYQIAKGSNQALTITVDSHYDGQYVYMKLNDRYVLLRDAGTQSTLTYTLVNITGSISIGIVVSETPDLDPDNPSSNVEIRDGSEIWTESGQVCIRTDIPVTVRIVTFNGRVQVQQNLSAGETRIQLPDGFYIVALSDGTTKKIAVRGF